MTKEIYLVEVEIPEGVSIGEMRRYIEDAVGSWKGQLHPDDPLFELEEPRVLRATSKRLDRAKRQEAIS